MLPNDAISQPATILQFPCARVRPRPVPGVAIPDDAHVIAALNRWRGSFSPFSLKALRDRKKTSTDWLAWPHLLVPYAFFRDASGHAMAALGYWDVPLAANVERASDWATATGLTVWLDRPPNLRAAILRRGDAITWPMVTVQA